MTPKQKTTKTARPISFRPSTVTAEHLEELSKLWGEDRTAVINRCIERVWLWEQERNVSEQVE